MQKRGSAVLLVDNDGRGPTQRALSDARLTNHASSHEYVPANPQVSQCVWGIRFNWSQNITYCN